MSPNGLRRWRRYAKKCRYRSRKEGKVSNATGASLRALFFAARIHPNYAVPPKPFTSRSIVGMTQGSRKRAIARCEQVDLDPVPRLWFRLGQRLRPCPGCCACWGADVSPADFGYDAECFGPRVTGHTKREIRRMWKWQRNLVDDCDGSGVLPARRSK